MALDAVSQSRCFGGIQFTYQHQSSETGTPMRFAAFVPPRADHRPVPVVWYPSGLTCIEENFTVNPAGMQYRATRRARTTSDWARDFTSMQRNRAVGQKLQNG
jgi:S-formylglutathione hydrolase